MTNVSFRQLRTYRRKCLPPLCAISGHYRTATSNTVVRSVDLRSTVTFQAAARRLDHRWYAFCPAGHRCRPTPARRWSRGVRRAAVAIVIDRLVLRRAIYGLHLVGDAAPAIFTEDLCSPPG